MRLFLRPDSYTGQLCLGRFLVAFSETLVPLPLGIINHPVASLAWIGDGPWDLTECLVQGQVVTNGTLERVRDVSYPDRKLTERRWTNLPGGVGVTFEPVESVLESLVNFLQGEPLPGATVDR